VFRQIPSALTGLKSIGRGDAVHGHGVIRRLIARIRELQEKLKDCTCGGADGLTERDTGEVPSSL